MRQGAALYGIETTALKLLEDEVARHREHNLPVSNALVSLLKATHEMIFKRLKASLGNNAEEPRSPREMLVELEQFKSELQQLVRQENEMELQ